MKDYSPCEAMLKNYFDGYIHEQKSKLVDFSRTASIISDYWFCHKIDKPFDAALGVDAASFDRKNGDGNKFVFVFYLLPVDPKLKWINHNNFEKFFMSALACADIPSRINITFPLYPFLLCLISHFRIISGKNIISNQFLIKSVFANPLVWCFIYKLERVSLFRIKLSTGFLGTINKGLV